jgi:hypothetical protein
MRNDKAYDPTVVIFSDANYGVRVFRKLLHRLPIESKFPGKTTFVQPKHRVQIGISVTAKKNLTTHAEYSQSSKHTTMAPNKSAPR